MSAKPKKSIETRELSEKKSAIDFYMNLANYHRNKSEKHRKVALESSLLLIVDASSSMTEFLNLSLEMYAEKDLKFLERTNKFLKSMLAELKFLNQGLEYFREATQVESVEDLMKYTEKVREHISNYKQVLDNAVQSVNSSGSREILKPPEEVIYYLKYIALGATSIANIRKISDKAEGITLLAYEDWKRLFRWLEKRGKIVDKYIE